MIHAQTYWWYEYTVPKETYLTDETAHRFVLIDTPTLEKKLDRVCCSVRETIGEVTSQFLRGF